MNETEPRAAARSPDLALQPLDVAALPAAVQKLLGAPAAAKAMAAKGIAALRPAELLLAIYQLAFDPDPAVQAAARAAPGVLPDKVLLVSLPEPLPAVVLHFFAQSLAPSRHEVLEKLLLNRAIADQTLALLATRLSERELDIIFQNETRWLACPSILEALYHNPRARMSSVSRAVELCVRNGVRLDGIEAFDDLARAVAEDLAGGSTSTAPTAPTAPAAPAADEVFAASMGDLSSDLPGGDDEAASAGTGPAATGSGIATDLDADSAGPGSSAGTGALDGPDLEIDLAADVGAQSDPAAASPASPALRAKKGAPQGNSNRKSPIIDFARLKMFEKIRLATLGNAYCRQNLVRDPNRIIALAAVRSPRITDGEIVAFAANRGICEDVIRYIANTKELVKSYPVRLNLVTNPKCPLTFSLRFLAQLQAEDLKNVSKSKNVPVALAAAARRLVQKRAANA